MPRRPRPKADPAAAAPAAYIPGGRIPLLQGDITIDSNPDDAAWQGRARTAGRLRHPAGRQHARSSADHGAHRLYRRRCTSPSMRRDPDPSQIRAQLRDRDAAFNDDWVGVFLDTFDDHRRAYG